MASDDFDCIILQEVLDELASLLTDYTTRGLPDQLATATEKIQIRFTSPAPLQDFPSPIVTCESPFLLAASGETGLRTWEAALHLGHFCSVYGQSIGMHGMNVLELGAGTGFLSILFARYFNAHHVLATDGSDEVVRGIRSNLHLNELSDSQTFKTSVLLWGQTLTDELFSVNGDHKAVVFDLVIGADLVGTGLHLRIAYTVPSHIISRICRRLSLIVSCTQASIL